MGLPRLKLFFQKTRLYIKKWWWIIVIVLALIVSLLIWAITRNGSYTATLLELIEIKRDSHDAEMETLAHTYNVEISEKNKRLEEHQRRLADLEEAHKAKGDELDRNKKAALKRLVDENYNDSERLSREIAKEFGLEHG